MLCLKRAILRRILECARHRALKGGTSGPAPHWSRYSLDGSARSFTRSDPGIPARRSGRARGAEDPHPSSSGPGVNHVPFYFASGSFGTVLSVDAETGWIELRGERVAGDEDFGWVSSDRPPGCCDCSLGPPPHLAGTVHGVLPSRRLSCPEGGKAVEIPIPYRLGLMVIAELIV